MFVCIIRMYKQKLSQDAECMLCVMKKWAIVMESVSMNKIG